MGKPRYTLSRSTNGWESGTGTTCGAMESNTRGTIASADGVKVDRLIRSLINPGIGIIKNPVKKNTDDYNIATASKAESTGLFRP